jgi:hypothetical protein
MVKRPLAETQDHRLRVILTRRHDSDWSIATRAPYTATVEQIRQPLYTQLADGSIRNSLRNQVEQQADDAVTIGISIEGCPARSWTWMGWSGSHWSRRSGSS